MSERTTGRKMLADLDKRVCHLEGNGHDPVADLRKDLAERLETFSRRLSEVEAKLAETPPADPPKVAKAKKGAA